jgi:hypothetical protein
LTDINTPPVAAGHDVLCMTARMQNDEPIRPRIFATALIALLAAAGGLGYWKSLHDRCPKA